MPARAPLLLALVLTVLLLAAPARPASAQPAPLQPDHGEMAAFVAEYTGAVMLGVAAGGLLLQNLVGGGPAVIAGALAGSGLASWLFIDHLARSYVIRRAASPPGR